MSFLRRVLARGQGRGVLEGAARHVFRREVEVSSPALDAPAPRPTATRTAGPAPRAPEPARSPERARPRTPPSVPTVETRVERSDPVERHVVHEPHTTIVYVHGPAMVPPVKTAATAMPPHEIHRDVEHHHHHAHTHRELRETHREVTERIVVETTAPQAVVPPPRRSMSAPRVERAPAAVAPAAPPPVHVSIGRIVLSAAPAPTKPERPRRAVAPARSLAEILAAKKGRP